jgi:hypothetical protein
MKLEELSLLRIDGLSENAIEKLKIVLAFYDRLPSEAMKEELLILMERQPLMLPGEFDLRLDDFAARVKAAPTPSQMNVYLAYSHLAKMH